MDVDVSFQEARDTLDLLPTDLRTSRQTKSKHKLTIQCTWLVMSRHDTFDVSSNSVHGSTRLSRRPRRRTCHVVSKRDVTSQVEFWLIQIGPTQRSYYYSDM